MLRSKLLWAIILGIATSVLLVEAKIHYGYSPLETRIAGVLTAPGTHLATSLNQPGVLMSGWQRFWTGLAIACNWVIYVFVWYILLWIVTFRRAHQNPYDHQDTMVPPLTH